MRVIICGATGMVGQGVLRECLQAKDVDLVQTIGRNPTGQRHPKLREMVHAEMANFAGMDDALGGFDACFFCLGQTSAHVSEQAYTHLTYDLALAAALALAPLNPTMVFVYVSAAGADSSERSATMWERVRGKTENALLRLPFRGVYIFRPAMIRPLDGIRSRTPAYRLFYSLIKPLLPLLHAAMPRHVVSTRELGRAMLAVVRYGAPRRVLESADISRLGRAR